MLQASSESDKKYQIRSGIITFVVCLLLFLLAWFLKVWKLQTPEMPSFGIEMAFGEVTEAKKNEPAKKKTSPISKPEVEEKEELAEPEEKLEEEEEKVEPVVTEEVKEPEPVEPEPVDLIEEDIEEPEGIVDEIPENEELKPEEIIEEKKMETEAFVEKKKEEPEPKPEEPKKATALYPETNPSEAVESSENDSSEGTSENSTETKKEGSKESKKKELEPVLYPNSQTSSMTNSASLEMSGWAWDGAPKPDDKSKETGKIVFQIKIDDQGEILSVTTVEKSVSSAVEQVYKREVEKLSFSPIGSGDNLAPISVGKITFVIKSN